MNKNVLSPRIKRFVGKLTKEQKYLRRRILEISHEGHTSHIGSCFSSIDLIAAVYEIKKNRDKFILSNGHAGIAWYVVLEKYGMIKNPVVGKYHIHPDRNVKEGIEVSTGSLGQGLPIAVGMAIADKKNNIYCMISDGECAEGSIWESVRIASELGLSNLKIILNANGFGAYGAININTFASRFKSFGLRVISVPGHDIKAIKKKLLVKVAKPLLIIAKTEVEQLPSLKGQEAHYRIMSGEDFNQAMEILK